MEAAAADVVFLQEVAGARRERWRDRNSLGIDNQLEFLADRLWPHHAYGRNAIARGGHHGNAILSRFPFVSWENINVSNLRFASRSLLHGVIDAGQSNPVHLVCVHLGLLEVERNRQLRQLVGRIRSHVPDDHALIVAGDFNDWMGRAEHQLEAELGLKEVFKSNGNGHARSYPSWFPLLAVDRIYYRGMSVRDCERLTGRPWRRLSDHIPLRAAFD